MTSDESFLTAAPDALSAWDDDAFAQLEGVAEEESVEELLPAAGDLQQMLAALADAEKASAQAGPSGEPVCQSPVASAPETSGTPTVLTPPALGSVGDPELAEAFVLDGARGVELLDQAIIDLESGGDVEAAVATICRELHTLKGAAATIGLAELGQYLHAVEDIVDEQKAGLASGVDRAFLETLIACADAVRKQIAHFTGTPETASGEETTESVRLDAHSDADDAISVKASQLDRMLDMLSALVMLRNQREARVEQLRHVEEEVARCGSRLREVERRITCALEDADQVRVADHSNPLREVGSDLLEISRNLRATFQPVADENVAVSNFIRQFRQALVTILRMPVSGLFRRLQRAVLDAARVEEKQVRLVVLGADVGLERSVQERLFEPLLHIVRNAVGHGIETPSARVAAGKDPTGSITLEATGTPHSLVLTIRDDGRGLDYEAIRKRGVERGLIDASADTSEEQLAQLIFARGFSTREATNAVAGRGVGMDVVADTLARMNAYLDVESETGHGTTIRLTIPLRSLIDQAMVFRVGQQLFALPMTALVDGSDPAARDVTAHDLLGFAAAEESGEAEHVMLEAQSEGASALRLAVDELLGPEEVVIRPLPPLLRHQTLYRGVTLSGSGEIVLVLHPGEFVARAGGTLLPRPQANAPRRLRVLIVDDSLSARRAAGNLFRQAHWEAVEASDGNAALQRLRGDHFDAVVTDFDMPQMNGLELIQRIREEANGESLPIVMLSSREREEMESVALAAGASLYLQKPMTEGTLETVLQEFAPNPEGPGDNHEEAPQ